MTSASKKHKNKRTIYVLIISIIALLGIFGSWALIKANSERADYQAVINSCDKAETNKFASCLSGAMLTYTQKHPEQTGSLLTYVYSHVRSSRNIDVRLLSDTAHRAGMMLSMENYSLKKALPMCGNSFKSACMHGFVMMSLDMYSLPQPTMITDFLNYCQVIKNNNLYPQCIHGVGHELWAKTNLDLNQTLKLCSKFNQGYDETACQSGILMEYSKGASSRGQHSDMPSGKEKLPCTSLNVAYQGTCFIAEASYRQYIPGWESPATTYTYCSSILKNYQFACMEATSERLLMAKGGNPSLAEQTCQSVSHQVKTMCLQSINVLL
jgi:hypothetical protein